MKDEEKRKEEDIKNAISNKPESRVKKVDPKFQEEQQMLFTQADDISPINKKIDKAEIIELKGGEYVNIDEYIAENYAEASTHFFRDFYNCIADLLGVSRDVMKPFKKISIVPLLKRQLIYGRFPNAVQIKIYKKNPYTGYCTRQYWNYQLLTIKGDLLLRGFICDFQASAQRVIEQNGNLKTFINEYCREFGLPIQMELFQTQQ